MEELLKEISLKLDVLIAELIARKDAKGDSTKKESALRLRSFGLSNKSIALILGSTERSIAELTRPGRSKKMR